MPDSDHAPLDDPFAARGSHAITHQRLFEHLYPAHLETLQARLQDQLQTSGHDLLVLTAGSPANHLFDDQPASYRANPHLRQWVPIDDCLGAALILEPGSEPQLLFLQPEDYWHLPPRLPQWTSASVQVQTFADEQGLQRALSARLRGLNGVALVGDATDHAHYGDHHSNPPKLLAMLDYDRAVKTEFEQECMRLSTRRGVAGHIAAERMFRQGADDRGAVEFDIHNAFLQASLQTEQELPYGNIVALNTHAAVLHYQHQDRRPAQPTRSLLIDAGARCHGYASDITRTYCHGHGLFAELVDALDLEQRQLINGIDLGQSYLELHEQMHRRIARLLCDCGLFRCNPEQAFAQRLTEAFFPHGLGHLLGLQTHDVAGQADRSGRGLPPPPRYETLRFTRRVEVGQVFTIEPGIYFIPMLYEPLLAGTQGALINRAVLAELRPFGGVRIEDNVLVTSSGMENFTRDSFAAQGAD